MDPTTYRNSQVRPRYSDPEKALNLGWPYLLCLAGSLNLGCVKTQELGSPMVPFCPFPYGLVFLLSLAGNKQGTQIEIDSVGHLLKEYNFVSRSEAEPWSAIEGDPYAPAALLQKPEGLEEH